ncbi:uncharacterized protein N0V89_000034 [Didymosphaeria variabile]|uniref:F-box domain-containing protein n=1 Tax=Didymosphaeria variabile TaxID=1932322 RepID=A0A9W9CFH9_9PLEO|nr:uncharacterized protein N0V89_000034 [Didymosphaeria variabile]KAJ4359480.1 hypothetical protein N0V89_000034 [Didymosphaeria variabile]
MASQKSHYKRFGKKPKNFYPSPLRKVIYHLYHPLGPRRSKRIKMAKSRFFDLPRELRDNIYELLLTENQNPGSTTPSFHFMPLLRFQLVNRQFGKEYTEAILSHSTMVAYQPNNPRHNYKQYINQVGHIQVYFRVTCEASPTGGSKNCHPNLSEVEIDDGTDSKHSFTCGGITEAAEWVNRLQQVQPNLPYHQKLDLRIGLYWCSDEEFAWPRHIHAPGLQYQLDAMTKASSNVNSVEVALFDCDPDYESWTKNDLKMDLWAKWTKSSGWQAGEAKGRRKVDAEGSERDLERIRQDERMRVIGPTMRLMDPYW